MDRRRFFSSITNAQCSTQEIHTLTTTCFGTMQIIDDVDEEDEEDENDSVEEDSSLSELHTILSLVDGLEYENMKTEEKDVLCRALKLSTALAGTCLLEKGTACEGVTFILSSGPAAVHESTGEWCTAGSALNLEALLFGELMNESTIIVGAYDVHLACLPRESFDTWSTVVPRLRKYKFPLLSTLSPAGLESLGLTHKWYQPGEALDSSGQLLLVTHGVVHVREDTSRLFPGHILGVREIMCNVPCVAVAEAPTGCAVLSGECFRALVPEEPDFMLAVCELSLKRITGNEIREFTFKDTEEEDVITPEQLKITTTLTESKDVGGQMINGYSVRGPLGRGATATVLECVKDSMAYAAKVVRRKEGMFDTSLVREISALKQLHHRNIIGVCEIIDCPTADAVIIVQEYAAWGSLLGVVLPQNDARSVFKQCIKGLEHMHSKHLIHCDIKPANILRTASGCVKIADFGCTVEENVHCSDLSGTPAFVSPELCEGQPPCAYTDTWALVATLYCIVYGRPPFLSPKRGALTEAILYKQVSFPPLSTYRSVDDDDVNLQHLLTRGLEKQLHRRLGALKDISTHTWLTAYS